MFVPLEDESLADDEALFGSGHGAWDHSPQSGQLNGNGNHGNTDVSNILHYQTDSLDDLSLVNTALNMQDQGQDNTMIGQGSGGAQSNMPTPIPGSSKDTNTPKPGTSRDTNNVTKENEEPVVRNKTFKNKENKSKNVNQRNTPNPLTNGFSETVTLSGRRDPGFSETVTLSGRSDPPSRTSAATWKPKLQYKKYDNDIDSTGRKSKNSIKQKKQNMNKNSVLIQQTPENLPCANDSPESNDYMLSQFINPNMDPRNVSTIDDRRRRNHVITPQQVDNDSDLDDFYSVHGKKRPHNNDGLNHHNTLNGIDDDDSSQTSIKICDTNNFIRFQNNLWDNKDRDKNRNTSRIVEPFTAHLNHADLETDSDLPDENTTVLKLQNPVTIQGQGTVPKPDLGRAIVVSFPHNNLSDNALQLNSSQISPTVLTRSNSTGVSIGNVPTSMPLSHASSDSLLGSLPSNLPSNILFGEGDNDYLLAQELQRKYNRENVEIQSRGQYDHPSTSDNFRNFTNRRDFQTNIDEPESNYFTAYANESETGNGRLTTDLYDPGEDHYIQVELQSRGPSGVGNQETITTLQPEVITIPHEIQSDELYPETSNHEPSRFYPTQTGHPEFSIQEEGPRDEPAIVDDEAYARMIQEQLNMDIELQDEQYARILQESEGDPHHYGGQCQTHHHRLPRSESEDSDYQPLRTRMNRDSLTRDSSWERPLRVGPPRGPPSYNTPQAATNVSDSRIRGQSTWARPLTHGNQERSSDFAYLDNVHDLPLAREPAASGYDIAPDYYYRYEMDPDYGDEHLISISRDPYMLASMLMERSPNMMIPNGVDLNDYEALWDLAEGLGEVRRVGMEEEEIALLPVHTYQAAGATGAEDDKTDCLVCLSEFTSGERLRTLPCCHIYHVGCIDEWLKRNAVCPVCRQSASQR